MLLENLHFIVSILVLKLITFGEYEDTERNQTLVLSSIRERLHNMHL